MRRFGAEMVAVTEGSTRLVVPEASLGGLPPPAEPAFFNPRARLTRDVSVAACAAFLARYDGPAVMLDALSGLGARGLRVANEAGAGSLEAAVLNDINPRALALAAESAAANGLEGRAEFSEAEACRFLAGRSSRGRRGAIVDADPFGSPAPFLDCCVRALEHGGMLSVTATDLQVLNGMFPGACERRYGGIPVRRSGFGNEVAIRLVLGCLRRVTARLGLAFEPLFVGSDQHYYRAFVRLLGRPDTSSNMGHVFSCAECGERGRAGEGGKEQPAVVGGGPFACGACGRPAGLAGPLWTGPLFDGEFLRDMRAAARGLDVGGACRRTLDRAAQECGMPAAYHTLDGVASRLGISPPRLDRAVALLRRAGFSASPTSLDPTGFRTDAAVAEMRGVFA